MKLIIDLFTGSRRYSQTLVAVAGLLSTWAVHVAGFTIRVPNGLSALLDPYFISIFLIQFTLIFASCLLAARYSMMILDFISAIFISVYLFVTMLFSSRRRRLYTAKGRRAIRVGGLPFSDRFAKRVISSADNRFHSLFLGISYFLGTRQAAISVRAEQYAVVVQAVTALSLISWIYLDVLSFVVLLGVTTLLFFMVPPQPIEKCFNLWSKGADVSFLDVLTYRPDVFLSVPKIVLIVLSLAFLTGTERFRALVSQPLVAVKIANETIYASIVAKTSSGLLLSVGSGEVLFLPDEAYSEIGAFE